MKYIHYEGASIMTGDEIADALIEYAAALAENGRADTVEVLGVAPDGSTTRSKFLVGPASEMVVEEAPDDLLHPEDPAFVVRLREAAAAMTKAVPHADDPDRG